MVAFSSDAPYASPDPWAGIAAATQRTTRTGRALGPHERVDAREALAMYLGPSASPGGPARRVEVGAPADLCLLANPLPSALAAPGAEQVRATFISGLPIYMAAS